MTAKKPILQLRALRQFNRRALLRELLRSGALSRVELARRLNCDGTTISRGIRPLLEAGMVREVGRRELQRGRPQTLVELNAAWRLTVGVALEPGRITGVTVDWTGAVLNRDRICFRRDVTRGELLAALDECLDRLLAPVKQPGPPRIAVAVFGHFGTAARIVEKAAGFPALEHTDLAGHIAKRYGARPELVNSTLASAAACNWPHRTEPAGATLWVALGEGIGSALFHDGRIFASAAGHPGEFGHTSCDWQGRRCRCGRRGCLEASAAIPALLEQAGEAGFALSWEEFVRQWRDHEPLCAIVLAAARYLACGIANAVHIQMPAVLQLSGELLQLGTEFSDCLSAELREQILAPLQAQLTVTTVPAGCESAATGAAITLIARDFAE